MWARRGGSNLAGPRGQSPLHVPLLLHAQQILLYQTSAFPSSGTVPLWSPKTLPTTTSFVFNWRWYLRRGVWPFWRLLSIPGFLPGIHVIKLLFDFSLVHLLHVSLILRPARKTYKGRGSVLPPPHCAPCSPARVGFSAHFMHIRVLPCLPLLKVLPYPEGPHLPFRLTP